MYKTTTLYKTINAQTYLLIIHGNIIKSKENKTTFKFSFLGIWQINRPHFWKQVTRSQIRNATFTRKFVNQEGRGKEQSLTTIHRNTPTQTYHLYWSIRLERSHVKTFFLEFKLWNLIKDIFAENFHFHLKALICRTTSTS